MALGDEVCEFDRELFEIVAEELGHQLRDSLLEHISKLKQLERQCTL